LVAHLFGGKVQYVFSDQKKHLGFREVSLRSNPLWGDSCKGALYVSHNEHVVSVPEGFSVSATSPEIPIEGLSHPTSPIWTFQPHPEAGPKFAEQREKKVIAEPSRFRFGQGLVHNFLNFCRSK
jgi:GMP synthase (glutamine-hydrolysing)